MTVILNTTFVLWLTAQSVHCTLLQQGCTIIFNGLDLHSVLGSKRHSWRLAAAALAVQGEHELFSRPPSTVEILQQYILVRVLFRHEEKVAMSPNAKNLETNGSLTSDKSLCKCIMTIVETMGYLTGQANTLSRMESDCEGSK